MALLRQALIMNSSLQVSPANLIECKSGIYLQLIVNTLNLREFDAVWWVDDAHFAQRVLKFKLTSFEPHVQNTTLAV